MVYKRLLYKSWFWYELISKIRGYVYETNYFGGYNEMFVICIEMFAVDNMINMEIILNVGQFVWQYDDQPLKKWDSLLS